MQKETAGNASTLNKILCKPFIWTNKHLWAAFVGAGTVLIVAYATVMYTKPEVNVENSRTFEAGTVRSGYLSHDFILFNPHPYALNVEASEEGCACTMVYLDKKVIGPYGHLPVHTTVEVEGKGQQTEGAKIITSHAGRTAQTWLFISFDADLKHGTGERAAK